MKNFTYIDERKIGVWGWSYGGYLAGQMLAEDREALINCAVAVAPVVKWQLYGKISNFIVENMYFLRFFDISI